MKVELTAQMQMIVTAESGVEVLALRVWAENYWEKGSEDAELIIKFPNHPQPGSETILGPSVLLRGRKKLDWADKP